ncbi:DUF4190 domain-containing protein [Amycolatopsis sp. BJA-103]|uniref:DUF4190 domain-containing protein n=1 Tax=Amycolatopsis sp. BJA-103 TaxID=1911175 RepID=UPI000C77E21C|nr:DUF4190 domain-containing protein [Amycolatopsis sp. BJA-103]AUI62920.1 hypothetical protein BKN51_35405 [Amycolatopsis sp. BJA-103]PNE18762.1 hypothetical protein B1H26_13100 [Amycolatopsis sp. BJA-103]
MTYPQDPYGQQQPYGQQPTYGQQPPYGQPYQQPGYGYGPAMPPQDQGLAIAALVVSIASLVVCTGLLSVIGVIMGHIAHSKAKRGEAGGQGMALAAIIIGYIGVAIIVGLVLLFVIVGVATDWDFD